MRLRFCTKVAFMDATQYIIIVGCGRLGSILANQLSGAGHELVTIDRDERTFDKLSVEYSGFRLVGDAVERQLLEEAGIQRADVLFAATSDDNTNLMVAQIARHIYQVQRVVARVYDPEREAIFREFAVETISPTHLAADAFLNVIHQHQRKGH